jgi:hypothetical protein
MAKKRVYNKSTGRDYTYDTKYESSPTQRKNRAARNRARAEMMKKGKVKKGDGKDVDHINGNPRQKKVKGKSNLQVLSASRNRAKH